MKEEMNNESICNNYYCSNCEANLDVNKVRIIKGLIYDINIERRLIC
jgi:hypothetical protein